MAVVRTVRVALLFFSYGVFIWAKCPEGWTTAGFYCYKSFSETKTWKDAESHCQTRSHKGSKAHLVSISDIPENALMKGWLETTRSSITESWIGLHPVSNSDDALVDTWTDGNVADLSVWAEIGILGEEFMYMKEMCLTLNTTDGLWLPTKCNQPHSYVCKLSTCPSGWIAYGGRCYHVFMAKKSWVHAEKHCRSFSKNSESHLVSIADAMENRFLLTMTQEDNPESFWIRMKDMSGKDRPSVWSEDNGFDLATIGKVANNTCVKMRVKGDIVWTDAACNDKLPYICKLSMCRRGWTAYDGSCLRYNSETTIRKPAPTPSNNLVGKTRVRRGFKFNNKNFRFKPMGSPLKSSKTKTTKAKNTYSQPASPATHLASLSASQPLSNTMATNSMFGSSSSTASKQTSRTTMPGFASSTGMQYTVQHSETKPVAKVDAISEDENMRCPGSWTPSTSGCTRYWPIPKTYDEAKKHCESFTYTGLNDKAQAQLVEEVYKFLKTFTCVMPKVYKPILI